MSALIPAAAGATVGLLWASSRATELFFSSILFIALATSLAAAPAAVRSMRLGRVAGHLLMCCCGIAIGLGSAGAGVHASTSHLPLDEPVVTWVEGRVREVVASERSTVRITLSGAGSRQVRASARGTLVVHLSEPFSAAAGDRIRVELPQGSGGLWYDDAGRTHARGGALVLLEPHDGGLARMPVAFNAVRMRVLNRAYAAIGTVAGSAAPLLEALLLGDRAHVDPRLETLFRRAGALHLLALSGMHLAVIALLVRALVRPLAGPRAAGWAAVASAILYLAIAGPRPGLVRACILVSLVMALREIDRSRPIIEVLAGAFLIQITVWPGVAGELGFQLSYLSLLGIAVMAGPLSSQLERFLPPLLAAPLAAGVGASLFTAPVILGVFGVWYPGGILASIVMSPMVLLFLVMGLVATLATAVGVAFIAPVSRPVLELLADAAGGAGWFFAGVPGLRPAGQLVGWQVGLALVAALVLAAGLRHLYRRSHGVA